MAKNMRNLVAKICFFPIVLLYFLSIRLAMVMPGSLDVVYTFFFVTI